MRHLLIAMLLVGAANPTLAADRDNPRWSRSDSPRSDDSDRSDRREARSTPAPAQSDGDSHRSESQPQRPNVFRSQRTAPAGVEVDRAPMPGEAATLRHDGRRNMDGRNADARNSDGRRGESVTPALVEPAETRDTATPTRRRPISDTVREWRSTERRRADSPSSIEERNLRHAPAGAGSGELVQPDRPLPRVFDPDRRDRRVSRTPVPGTEPVAPVTASDRRAHPEHRWRSDWRRDHRYDWRDHRRHHSSLFRLGLYLDPFGWDYYRYGIGWRMWPGYYSSRYWLIDPWQYRLPPAYGPYRWIRYHDDALLVNIYTGEVVDVIYDVFW